MKKYDLDRLSYLRHNANNVLELTKGFLPEQRNNNINTLDEFAIHVLELTQYILSIDNEIK